MLYTLAIALQNSWLAVLITALLAYLLGSISTAVLVSKGLFHEDIRQKGSGNAGATNILRNYGAKAAVLTTIGDLGKSILAVFLGGWLLVNLQLTGTQEISATGLQIVGRHLAGLCCVLGHLYPLFFSFQGGKGVMASCGMIFILDYRVALLCLAIFAITVLLSRMVSLSSIVAVFCAPFLVYVYKTVDGYSVEATCFCTAVIAVISCIVIIKHRTNIMRILHGNENRLSFHKSDKRKQGS